MKIQFDKIIRIKNFYSNYKTVIYLYLEKIKDKYIKNYMEIMEKNFHKETKTYYFGLFIKLSYILRKKILKN